MKIIFFLNKTIRNYIFIASSQDSTLDQVELHKTIQWSSNSSYKAKDELTSQRGNNALHFARIFSFLPYK